MRKQKKEHGITLVALVITIIVLIILAGISIGMIVKYRNCKEWNNEISSVRRIEIISY